MVFTKSSPKLNPAVDFRAGLFLENLVVCTSLEALCSSKFSSVSLSVSHRIMLRNGPLDVLIRFTLYCANICKKKKMHLLALVNHLI